MGLAALAAARHDFAAALRYGRARSIRERLRRQRLRRDRRRPGGTGSLSAGIRHVPTMVDTKPGLSSYARVSYARELQGDVAGALRSMEAARDVAGSPSDVAWASFQIGELRFNRGWFLPSARSPTATASRQTRATSRTSCRAGQGVLGQRRRTGGDRRLHGGDPALPIARIRDRARRPETLDRRPRRGAPGSTPWSARRRASSQPTG